MGTDLRDRHILVAEDEYMVAWHMSEMLRAEGATVVGPVATVEAALRAVADSARLDGAVLDVNLGGVMAYAVADALRARDIPYVLATGYDASVIPEPYRSACCVQKPVDMAAVTRALGVHIDAASPSVG